MSDSRATKESMSVQSHYRLARTFYFTAMIPPLGLALLCAWILPQLPAITADKLTSLETPFLGFTLLSAVLCDTLFYLRLKRFRALPTPAELAQIPSMIESKRGWKACLIAWSLVQVYAFLGVMEAFFTREDSSMFPFMIFAAITMYRCRPRAGLFAESNWGTPFSPPRPIITETGETGKTGETDGTGKASETGKAGETGER